MGADTQAPSLKNLRDDGVVMDGVADHERELTRNGGAADHGRTVAIELCLDLNLAIEQRGIDPPDEHRQPGCFAHGGGAAGFDICSADASIVGTEAGGDRREQRGHVIEAVPHVSANAS